MARTNRTRRGAKLTGKNLELAQEMVREMLKANRESIERYSIIPPTLPRSK
jgi:hypothetical protein